MVNKMKVKDIMTKDIVSCNINDEFKEVAKLMLNYDIGFIPVKKDKKVVGVITDRDMVIYGLANDNNSIEKCMKTILVTGAAGFIGANLVTKLIEKMKSQGLVEE